MDKLKELSDNFLCVERDTHKYSVDVATAILKMTDDELITLAIRILIKH
jgi:hypothetical protein